MEFVATILRKIVHLDRTILCASRLLGGYAISAQPFTHLGQSDDVSVIEQRGVLPRVGIGKRREVDNDLWLLLV
jgi:hypothetical protein